MARTATARLGVFVRIGGRTLPRREGADPHLEGVRKMRRTILPVVTAVLVVAMLGPTSAGAAVDNGGCPPEESAWVLITSYEEGYQRGIDAAIANGYTVEQLEALYGVAPGRLYEDAYLPRVVPLDKNGDGMVCALDYGTGWGLAKKYPWASNVVDNVLPH
jgi:hypothetical protein